MKKYLLTLSLSLLSASVLLAQDNSTINLQLPVKKLETSKDSIASIQVISTITFQNIQGVVGNVLIN